MEAITRHVAYLGLGTMGGPMAANLAASGMAVRGWNRTPTGPWVGYAAERGVDVRSSAADAVDGATHVFVNVDDGRAVEDVLWGTHGAAAHLSPGAVVVDNGTIGPRAARAHAARLAAAGIAYLDAPVTGGDVGARNATLAIMVGGDGGLFDRARPLLEAMGRTVVHCGAAGAGQALKLVNQVLCAVNLVSVCEGLTLASALGIDPRLVLDVCTQGAAGSWALANLGPRILDGDYAPGFKVRHMVKDLRLVAEQLDGPLPASTQEALGRLGVLGDPEEGTQAMMRTYTGN